VIGAGQRADAERRVNAWKEAHSTIKQDPAVPSAPSSPPPGAAAKAQSAGCPGWPFPTLPCTEQFPALPGTQGPPRASSPQQLTAKAPIEELNEALAQMDCASLRSQISAQGSVSISGTVPDGGQKTKLVQLAGRLFPNGRPEVTVDIVPPPLCRSVVELQVMRAAGLIGDGGLRMRLNNGSSQLRQGDPMRLEIQGPAYATNLRIDYFSLDGQVAHMKPEGGEPAPKLAAGTTHLFGNPANGELWNAGGAPFGTELITVIATSVPLDLGASRPKVELATGYLRDLNRTLGRISVPSGQPNVIATLLVRTSP
jgi:hypothetical protein